MFLDDESFANQLLDTTEWLFKETLCKNILHDISNPEYSCVMDLKANITTSYNDWKTKEG